LEKIKALDLSKRWRVNVTEEELVKSTTKLSTKEMTEYQENCERWAASLGWSWEL